MKINILVDARLNHKSVGGVQHAISGLAEAFSSVNFPDLSFKWLVNSQNFEWLIERIPEDSELIIINSPDRLPNSNKFLERIRNNIIGDAVLGMIRGSGPLKFKISECPVNLSALKIDVIHFSTQYGFATNIPNIYQPHDFQHFHLPENFSKETLKLRKLGYKQMMDQSSFIAVGNYWTSADGSGFYPQYKNKFVNVPVYPRKLGTNFDTSYEKNQKLPFTIFYPAMNWPHKNHSRLLEAFTFLLRSGQNCKLILTGMSKPELVLKFPKITYDVLENIQCYDYLPDETLANLYLKVDLLVMPSLFESESIPIWEAFRAGTAVAAANITAIPAQVGEAAVLFDPLDSQDIYKKILLIMSNDKKRQLLVENGKNRVSLLTPENTAAGYRFYYRKCLKLEADNLDNEWLQSGFRF